MTAKTAWLTAQLSRHLDEIRSYFTSSRAVTIVIRDPAGTPEQNVVMGNDTPDDAIAAIEWSKQEENIRGH